MVPASRVAAAFAEEFGGSAHGTWFAPGRVNLIGEHTDYNDGFVLPVALDQGATADVRLRDDDVVRMRAVDLGESCQVRLADVSADAGLGWASYVAGVGWAARRRGLDVPGLEVAVSSDVPFGAGLSSSAALSCVVARAWTDLAGWDLTDVEVADLGRDAENQIAGAPTGVMDQLASVCGRAGHALQIDTRSLTITPVPFSPESAGAALLVIDSHTPHAHADGAYADRREACRAGAAQLGVTALRDVPIAEADRLLSALPDVLRRRARHVISDSHRVEELSAVLRSGDDLRAAGALLNASHASMRADFEITVPTVDLLQESAVAAGAYGARMTGGGFGGCVIALVDQRAVDSVVDACVAAAAAADHPEPTAFVARVGDGARRV